MTLPELCVGYPNPSHFHPVSPELRVSPFSFSPGQVSEPGKENPIFAMQRKGRTFPSLCSRDTLTLLCRDHSPPSLCSEAGAVFL